MLFDTYKEHRCRYLSFDFATAAWQRRSYHQIREKVFCGEQKLFEDTDQDARDAEAIHIMATCFCMGMQDRAVGAVRIYEDEPRTWYGGRLAVEKEYRRLRNFKTVQLFDARNPYHLFTISVGAALIFKAVSTATALGCDRFYANVQAQNEPFFQRLHWSTIETLTIMGMEHKRMEADLAYYPPSPHIKGLIKETG